MAIMTLGAITFARNPKDMTVIRAKTFTTTKLTYSSYIFYSFGNSIVGQVIELRWPYMTEAEFDSIDALLVAEGSVVFDPNDGSSADPSYNVYLVSLTGKYLMDRTDRKDVRLKLVIDSEV